MPNAPLQIAIPSRIFYWECFVGYTLFVSCDNICCKGLATAKLDEFLKSGCKRLMLGFQVFDGDGKELAELIEETRLLGEGEVREVGCVLLVFFGCSLGWSAIWVIVVAVDFYTVIVAHGLATLLTLGVVLTITITTYTLFRAFDIDHIIDWNILAATITKREVFRETIFAVCIVVSGDGTIVVNHSATTFALGRAFSAPAVLHRISVAFGWREYLLVLNYFFAVRALGEVVVPASIADIVAIYNIDMIVVMEIAA